MLKSVNKNKNETQQKIVYWKEIAISKLKKDILQCALFIFMVGKILWFILNGRKFSKISYFFIIEKGFMSCLQNNET